MPATFPNTAIQLSRHTLFKCRSVFDLRQNKRFDTQEEIVFILSGGDSSGKIQLPITIYLSVLPCWFAFNESVVCLKWHEPILQHLLSAINDKKVYFHNLQFPIIILAKGAGVLVLCAMRVTTGRESLSTWFFIFIFYHAFFSLALGVQVLLQSPTLCSKPHYQLGKERRGEKNQFSCDGPICLNSLWKRSWSYKSHLILYIFAQER